ncbi:hypothetical protein FGSG_07818 [Fusarium graminearum PH-1]|uniref:Chromosome 4, complete genome n=1 Tax=Gibberella zeae (strain ATCC MYA-4620 / CBS 123657 / FGSC 9075 / NRRL 31084 / PH-1) TaxID=229533 RepID=I1RUC9_GIBZE|nr:hypothetical protein FGSG_07818 [Fusarium graminearum PH-1]ESU14136.1 hypothetical protein FGSG_07818 [Fusarium graminearum PH-1]CAF3524572.1 unnamed protein product [Fusarium graminearum]CEF84385.1 unnamed protein product [Fusarium graminearum]|eukprot:XP_011327643.1 hypothetical protein FGSG_07818 [Fusarium graminearum PH-1]
MVRRQNDSAAKRLTAKTKKIRVPSRPACPAWRMNSIALYNVLELNFVIFGTFKKRSGLYFWSFLIATWGIAPNAIGYLLKHLALIDVSNLYATLIVIGWCTMVTGQSVVLYSRLHIVRQNQTVLRAVLAMIVFSAIVLHILVVILVYGSNSANPGPFLHIYFVYEKLQLTVFFVQETIISGLYIWESMKLLKSEKDIREGAGPKRVMNHLIYVNIIVIFLDISVVALEFANYYVVQTAYKPLVYSIKLKVEFSILDKLVELAQSSTLGSSYTRNRIGETAGVTLDTFVADGAGSSRWAVQWLSESHIDIGGNDGDQERDTTAIVRTTEIIVQRGQHWPDRDRDFESYDGNSAITTKSVADEEVTSSASSEIQLARAGY